MDKRARGYLIIFAGEETEGTWEVYGHHTDGKPMVFTTVAKAKKYMQNNLSWKADEKAAIVKIEKQFEVTTTIKEVK